MNKSKRNPSLWLAIVVGVGLAQPSVWAETDKKKKKKKSAVAATVEKPQTVGDILNSIERKSEKISVTKGKNELPQFQAELKAAAPSVDLKAVKPPSSNKLYYEEGTDEAQLEQVTDEGIKQLYALSQQYKQSPRRGELWLRLAEQYVEKARLIEFRIMMKNDEALAAFQAGKLKQRPKIDLSVSKEYNRKAIQLYEWFLRDFPKDPKIDQALFFLGFNYFEIGETKKGQAFYLRLTQEFPNSLYVTESNFALGEYNFENDNFKTALEYYGKVAAQKNNRLYAFALYKTAWCHYKLNQSLKGLTFLEQVIYEGRKSKGQNDKSLGGVSRIRLASEAVKDLIVFYAEAADYKKARAYFEAVVGEKGTNATLTKLANFYVDTANRAGARWIYKDLIAQDPNSTKAYDFQYAIVKAYSASGDPATYKAELYEWISQYGPNSSWQKVNAADKEATKKATEAMEVTLHNNVMQGHQLAQNARTKSAMATAKAGYDLYFQTFEISPRNDEMHFFYGELLYDMGDYEKAAYHYSWVVENSPQSKYYEKAVLNALLSYEKRLPTDAAVRKLVGKSTEPFEFDGSIKAFEKAAMVFVQKSPKNEFVPAVKYRLGSLYYLYNQFDAALKWLKDVVVNYPKTPYAKTAANHILDIYNLKNDYAGLQSAANEILAIPEMARSEVGEQIHQIKLRTDFKVAKELEDKKEYGKSASMYESFAARNRGADLANQALFNAAINYERAGDVLKAISVYAALTSITDKKAADAKLKAMRILPTLYERMAQYEKAAQGYDAFAKASPADAKSLGYLYNAGVIYDALNNVTEALKNYDSYYEKQKGADKFEVLFLKAKVLERNGMFEKAISEYNRYVTSGTTHRAGIIEAAFTMAKLHERLNHAKPAKEWYEKTVALQKKLSSAEKPVGASFAAEAKFQLVRHLYDDLIAIPVPANSAAQTAAIKKKLNLVNALKDQLRAVVSYDDGPQIVNALTTQGQALQHLYAAIVNAPAPAGLSQSELSEYRAGVQKFADPFKLQALEAYQAALNKGHELEAYTASLNVAQKNHAILKGEKNDLAETKAVTTKLPDSMGL